MRSRIALLIPLLAGVSLAVLSTRQEIPLLSRTGLSIQASAPPEPASDRVPTWTDAPTREWLALTADEVREWLARNAEDVRDNTKGPEESSEGTEDQAWDEALDRWFARFSLCKTHQDLVLATEALPRLGDDPQTRDEIEVRIAWAWAFVYAGQKRMAEWAPEIRPAPDAIRRWSVEHGPDLDRYQEAAEAAFSDDITRDQIASLFLVAERAREEGLERDPARRAKLALEVKRQAIMALANAEHYRLVDLAYGIPDEQVLASYDELVAAGLFDDVRVVRVDFATVPTESGAPAPDLETQRRLAEEVLGRARAGEDFQALAAKYSDGPERHDKPEWISVLDAADLLGMGEAAVEPGVIGDVREAYLSFVIVKVLERRAPKPRSRQDVSELRLEVCGRRLIGMYEEMFARTSVPFPLPLPPECDGRPILFLP